MLQYDNNAFNFFALAIISLYLVPSWHFILSKTFKVIFSTDSDIGATVRTKAEEKKAAELKNAQKGFKTLRTTGFLVNLAVTIFFTLVSFYILISVGADGEVNSFDPFTILDIHTSATNKEIKQAYRSKSLKFHPDKNPNNPNAEAMFMMVSKAYESLTDETAKENFAKYGNPDGKQSLEVSIGLPSFLLEADNRNLVLVTYLLIMVFLIPFFVWRYYSDSSTYGEKDVMYDSYSWYHHTLNEHSILKSLPETFAGSAEFRKVNLPTTNAERENIGTLMSKVRSQMQKPKFNHPVVVKGNVLLHSHLLRKTDDLLPKAKEDLLMMLRQSQSLVDAMITVCQHQDWLQTAANCIELSQCITQGIWTKDSTLMQLPHFTAEEVKHCEKGKGANRVKDLAAYLKIPDESKKGLADMTEEDKNDVLKCCALMPNITVESGVYVDDDEDDKVYEGDLVTVEVCITRNNLTGDEKAGLVHAPMFPFPKQEAWWVGLGTKEGKIISIEKVKDPGRVVEHKIKFLAPRKGEYEFDLIVKSNAYVGLDQKQKVKLTTQDASGLPEYKVHPDDAELDDEPTLFEDMLNANIEEDSDSDDSDDEEDEKGIKELTAAERKKQELINARKKAAGDDDSDSDVEEVYTEK